MGPPGGLREAVLASSQMSPRRVTQLTQHRYTSCPIHAECLCSLLHDQQLAGPWFRSPPMEKRWGPPPGGKLLLASSPQHCGGTRGMNMHRQWRGGSPLPPSCMSPSRSDRKAAKHHGPCSQQTSRWIDRSLPPPMFSLPLSSLLGQHYRRTGEITPVLKRNK